jgi:hypothetical protein
MEPLRIVVVRAYDDRTMVPPRQTSMPVLKVTYADALWGQGFGDRFEVARGSSRAFGEGVYLAGQTA